MTSLPAPRLRVPGTIEASIECGAQTSHEINGPLGCPEHSRGAIRDPVCLLPGAQQFEFPQPKIAQA